MDSADPPFPRPAGYWWFGCRAETKGSLTLANRVLTQPLLRRSSESAVMDVDDIVLDGGKQFIYYQSPHLSKTLITLLYHARG